MILVVAGAGAVAQEGIPASVKFRVVDDAGLPVMDVGVEGGFLDLSQSGVRSAFRGSTDSNGIFVARGKAVVGVYARFSREGFYSTIVREFVEYKWRADGRGYERIPSWDRDISVLLKRVRNPIPMYARPVRGSAFNPFERVGVYCLGRTSSYDFVRGAFLPPYGTGEVADVEFRWAMNIYSKDEDGLAVDYDTLSEIRMTNVLDGICRGIPDGGKGEKKNEGSWYISAYEAPLDGYTNVITFYERIRGRKAESNDDGHYLYYFRIRTQTNELGQVTNALYGKIYGQINGNFTYYLNPTPNDRNIEFDPNRNLFIFSDRERIGYLP